MAQDGNKRDYESLPGMQEALKTFETAFDYSKPLTAEDKFKMMLGRAQHFLYSATSAAKAAIHNPTVIVTALPLVNQLRLNGALEELSATPEGKELVDFARQANAKILLDPNPLFTGGHAANRQVTSSKEGYKHEAGDIRVAAFATRGEIINILAHELQHHRQVVMEAQQPIGTALPSPVEQLWFNRAVEADAQATAVDIAWKLKEAGKPKAWDSMMNGAECHSKIAQAYADAVATNPQAANDGCAKRAAFDEWHVAGNGQSGETLSKAYNLQGLKNALRDFAMDTIEKTEGKHYAPMTLKDIEKLGALSPLAKTNYLKTEGGKPLDDPFYRTADWNKYIAAGLKDMHREYDGRLEKQASKFMSKPDAPAAEAKNNLSAPKDSAPTIKRAVPALKM